MAAIPQHIIEQIRDSINILDVVQRYVNLKKRGQNFIGLCPFHQEKTPSFSVHPGKQIFHCFGCGEGGNVFSFLMKYEKISFIDAVKRLAEESGIALPTTPQNKRAQSENERLFRSNEIAGSFYHSQLTRLPQTVQTYLTKRNLHKETLAAFQIGFAPDSWDALLKFINAKKLPREPYQKLGLIMKSQQEGRLYDRFRNRLMFPIHNPSGKIVGFGGRSLTDDKSTPKYLNSPESSIYQKSRILYGLFQARDFIRERNSAIFVEGYMDFLQLFQAGIRNVVATSGTALTTEHASLIRRYAPEVILCYDSDPAGVKAAVRGGEILFQNSLEVRVLLLPPGEDPDSFVRNSGPEAFLSKLADAEDYFTFRLNITKQSFDLSSADGRSQAVQNLLEMLVPLKDTIRSAYFLEKIAVFLGIPVEMLTNLFQKKIRQARKREALQTTAEKNPEHPDTPSTIALSGAWSAERDILILLSVYTKSSKTLILEHLRAGDFLNREFQELFTVLVQNLDNQVDLTQLLLDSIQGRPLSNLFTRNLFSEIQQSIRYTFDCIRQIKIARLQAEAELIRQKLKDASSDDFSPDDLLRKHTELKQEQMRWQKASLQNLQE